MDARRRRRAFTLLEFMIVVVIAGILATIAYPAYRDHIARGRRVDGMQALQRIANEQQQYRLDANTFATTVAALGVPGISRDRHYLLSIPYADESTFLARATPAGSQSGDGPLQLDAAGTRAWDHDNDGKYTCSWEDASTADGC